MPAPPLKDAIVIALDVGNSVSNLHYWEEKTFFELSKNCVSRIIQRKIISDSNDVLSIVLIGSEESENTLVVSGYKHICCKFDFQLASWDMLKFVEKELKTTNVDSDWIGALVVSMEMLKTYEEYNDIQNKRIVFFSDFTQPASDDLDVITKSIKALDIQITIIGPEAVSSLIQYGEEDEPASKRKRMDESEGEKLLYQLWQKVPDNVVICTFESALKQLCSYVRKAKRVTCWNCILDIGDVKINISMLKKTDPKLAKKFNTKYSKPPDEPGTSDQSSVKSIPVVRDKILYYKHETGDGKEIVELEVKPEDTIEGYRYGTTVIPFSEQDKTVLEFKSGPKSFSVIGFSNITSVPYYLLSGECSYIVLPRDKDQNAEIALSAIIQAMKRMECLAIVRKVHMDNSRLALGILYPVIEEIVCDETDEVTHKEFLLYVELAFEEEVKSINFPSLEEVAKGITDDQMEAVDNLIDGMNLMKADKGLRGEPCEAFEMSSLHDLKEQFFHYCVIQRGLHPDKPLPKSLPLYIEEFAEVPKSIQENSLSLMKEIKKQFKIEVRATDGAKNKKKNREEDKTVVEVVQQREKQKATRGHFTESEVEEEKNAARREWMKLFREEFPVDSDLDDFFFGLSEGRKIKDVDIIKSFEEILREVRGKYLKINPDGFNLWMRKFGGYLFERDGLEQELWGVIVSENLGLISTKENQYSIVSEEEAEEFLCGDMSQSPKYPPPKNKKPDFQPPPDGWDDLLNEQMAAGPLS